MNWRIVNGWDCGPDTPSKHTDGGGGSNGFLSKPGRLLKLDNKNIFLNNERGVGREREKSEREGGVRENLNSKTLFYKD